MENQNEFDQPIQEQPIQEQPVQDQPIQDQPIQAPPVQPAPSRSPFADNPYMDAPAGWQPEPAPAKKKSGFLPLMSIVLSAAMVVAGCSLTGVLVSNSWRSEMAKQEMAYQEKLNVLQSELDSKVNMVPGQSVSGTPSEPGTGLTPAQVYTQTVESAVAITCTITTQSFGQTVQGTSSGSGFVLSEDGYIVTNYHVVDGASAITVATSDGTKFPATYIGGDEFNDIALVKAEAEGLKPVTVGSSANLIVGDQVVAIGNPLGTLASTLTVGYISAKDRVVTTDGSQISMLQTDAAINSGNSGGPLLNMLGQVVGITSAKYSGTSSSGATIEGIGFAIPIDDVIGMLMDLKEYGYITGAYLGVSVSNMDANVVENYGLPMGVLVREVTEGYCAAKAGIQPQDIIVDLGGYTVTNLTDLNRALRQFKAGDSVAVTVYRNGGQRKITVVLDEKPNNQKPAAEPTVGLPSGGSAGECKDYFDSQD